ncbi:hypothetical protein PR048_026734 [Dryococelus australis]|uniref:Endonuclease/exonuclease/phosphatase domain-containing protein n=1 Tax=Dryococelus australis TaxID=614101 RepID=A0ABQ9GM69_9NEOP|nr:hypothetical protein PR048_026734 [Dryococelus australis]
MTTDKQDKGNEVEMEASETILLSISTGSMEDFPKLLPSVNTNHDTLSNVSANVDDAATSQPTGANKYLNISSGPFVVFIEGQDKNVANLHPIQIGELLIHVAEEIVEILQAGSNRSHSAMDRDHCEMWTLELDIKHLMAMNNLTYRQAKLQLSPASHPKERHDAAFRHTIPQASQKSQFFPQAKTFLAVINSLRKRLLSDSQNKLRPIRNVIKIPQGLLHTTPTKAVSPMAIYYPQFHPDKTPSVNGALLRYDNGRLDNSHSPSASEDEAYPLHKTYLLYGKHYTIKLLWLLLLSNFLQHKINILQCNCRSLTQQREQLQHYAMTHYLDVIFLQETHLHFDDRRAVFSSYRFYMNGYTYIHGVAVLVSKHIPSAPVSIDFAHTEIELVGCVVHLGGKKLNIYSLYVLAWHSVTEHNWDLLFDSLPDDALIGGDFDSHNSVWGDSIIDRAGAQLANSVLNSRFSPLTKGHHTLRGSYERRSIAIDLTICSSTIVHYFHWEIDTDPLGSDHFPVLILLLPKVLASSVSLPGYSRLW